MKTEAAKFPVSWYMGLVSSSYISEKDIRILQEFTCYRSKLVSMRPSEKNRFQNAITVHSPSQDTVVSDMFSKSAIDTENHLLSTDVYNLDHCVSLLRSLEMRNSEALPDTIDSTSYFVKP